MKISLVYASTTGNTEQMANLICDELKSLGGEVEISSADSANKDAILASDLIVLGSPAMGDEVLEDSVETLFSDIESSISGKKIALFGSYDWGDGQWMRDWQDRVKSAGGLLVTEGLIVQLVPEGESEDACKNFAKEIFAK